MLQDKYSENKSTIWKGATLRYCGKRSSQNRKGL